MLGEQATAADIAKLRASYGLDQPLPVAVRLLAGRTGSRQPRSVDFPATAGDAGADAERAEPTFFLTLFSIVIATLIGIPCGIVAAVWRGKSASISSSRDSPCSARASPAFG